MIAIILAAGRGTRMGDLTNSIQKAMFEVLGKTLIEWKLEALPKKIDHIIFTVNYKKEQIINHFGNSWNGIPITYVEQEVLNGTSGALTLCREYIKDKALILMGDDIYNKEDLEKLISYDNALLVFDEGEEGLKKKGQVVEKDGLLAGLNEGLSQTGIPSSFINTGAYIISKEYFNFPQVNDSIKEYGIPNTLVRISKEIPINVIEAKWWIQITSPEHLTRAEKILSELN